MATNSDVTAPVSRFANAIEQAAPPAVLDGSLPLEGPAIAAMGRDRAHLAALWLARIVKPDGSFPYFYYPDTDRYETSEYNEVRHAGVTWALFQACELFDDDSIRNAAEAGARYILQSAISLPDGGAAYLQEGRCKLGGQALALIALLERRRVTQNAQYDEMIAALTALLQRMEVPGTPGRYYQSCIAATGELLLAPQSNYYPGEALLALIRLARQFPAEGHLQSAQRAAEYLIRSKDGDIIRAGRIPREDHWLTIALSELYQLDPNPDYSTVVFMQAEAMIASRHTAADAAPWQVGGAKRPGAINFTSTATKAEALLAAWALARYQEDHARIERCSEAALRTIQFMMRVQYLPESARSQPNPQRVIGAWAQDINHPQIRIDFVQHNLSALINASHLLADRAGQIAAGSPKPIRARFLDAKALDGPNIWLSRPVTVFTVDLGEPVPTAELEAIQQLLASMLRQLDDHFPNPSAQLDNAQSESIAGMLGNLAVNLQKRAGEAVTFSTNRPAGPPYHFEIAIEHGAGEAAEAAATLAARMIAQATAGPDASYDLLTDFGASVKKQVDSKRWSVSTQTVVDAARRRGIPVQDLDPKVALVQLGNGAWRRRLMTMTTSNTSGIGVKIAADKPLTNRLLREAGLPVPRGALARTADEAVELAARFGCPVVLKPLRRNKATGVFVNLDTPERIREFFPHVLSESRGPAVLVEEHIRGRDYRLLVVGGEVVSGYWRDIQHVIGDGSSSVRHLIDVANRDTNRGSPPAFALRPIEIDVRTLDSLSLQGLSLDSVPDPEQRINLAQIGVAGVTHDVTADIHPDNLAMALQAARIIDLDIAGIDIITPDIAASIWTTGGAIVEVNSGPGFERHLQPAYGKGYDVGQFVIDMLYPPGQPFRPPLIAVAGPSAAQVAEIISAILISNGIATGLATADMLQINSVRMRNGGCRRPSEARTLLENGSVEAAVVEVDPAAIVDAPLDFDCCDVAIIAGFCGKVRPDGRPLETALTDTLAPGGTLVVDVDRVADVSTLASKQISVVAVSLDADSTRIQRHVDGGGKTVFQASDGDSRSIAIFDSGTKIAQIDSSSLPQHHGGADARAILLAAAAAVALGIDVEIVRRVLQLA